MYKSNVCPYSTIGTFKGFLLQAWNVCLQKCFDEEITFLIDIFTNNRQLRVKEKKNARKALQKAYHEKHLKQIIKSRNKTLTLLNYHGYQNLDRNWEEGYMNSILKPFLHQTKIWNFYFVIKF